MGLGPSRSSLMNLLGLRRVNQLTEVELLTAMTQLQEERSRKRAIGRLQRSLKELRPRALKLKSFAASPKSLEELGLAKEVLQKLRESGRSDAAIIQQLHEKGVI